MANHDDIGLGGQLGLQLAVSLQGELKVVQAPRQQLPQRLLTLPQVVVWPPALH